MLINFKMINKINNQVKNKFFTNESIYILYYFKFFTLSIIIYNILNNKKNFQLINL